MGLPAQDPVLSAGPWSLRSISGEIGIEGMYQQRSTQYSDLPDEQTSKYLLGGIRLNTSSYLWDPGILSLMLGGEFNPESRNEEYLVIPDRSEVRTLRKLDMRATLFSNKPVNLTTWVNLDRHYFNREALTNILSNTRQWGASMGSNNTILPFTLRYLSMDWEQQETEADRTFTMQQQSLQARMKKSFNRHDRHELAYTFDDYRYTYSDPGEVTNRVHRISLNDQVYFDRSKRFGLQSSVLFFDQAGTYTFSKLDASERLLFHLPARVDVIGEGNLYRLQDPGQLITTGRFRNEVRHKLYESLTSDLFAEYTSTWHTVYREQEFRTGAGARYTKKIPLGRMNLEYRYYRYHNTLEGEPGRIHIINEPLTIEDAGSNLLSKPFIDPLTVTVTDPTGTILYDEGTDYLLAPVNDFLEIIRVPGGRIPASQSVLVSYEAMQPGTSHFEANNHAWNAGFAFFDRLLEIYYRGGMQDFKNVESAEFLTLNRYDQHVIGGRIYYKFVSGGVEYDWYNSSLVPYERINYFLNLNFRIGSNWILSANGSLRDYTLLGPDIDQRYMNLSGRASFRATRFVTINLNAGYLSQEGQNIDLGLLTGRLEAVFNMRKIYLKTGIIYYNRNYTNSNFTYSRAFIRLARVF
jgi:hypothetical protein